MKQLLKIIWGIIETFIKSSKKEDTSPPEIETPFSISDISKELPWHKSRTWSKRALGAIDKIVVHQSLTSYKNSTLEGINNYHIKPGKQNHISPNGAPHICYHFGIDGEGNVFQMNNLSHTVWHCKGKNTSAVGILVLGDFNGPSYEGKDVEPTEAQVVSLGKLTNNLLSRENLSISKQEVYGHKDFGKENCPGLTLGAFVDKFKQS